MKSLSLLLNKLDATERGRLSTVLAQKNTLATRYVQALIDNPSLHEKRFVQQEKMSKASFHKTKSLAYDFLLTWISENVAQNLSAAADMLWWFCSKGLYKEGWEYFLATEKKLQQKKNYQVLHALYTEAMRLQIYIANISAMEEIRDHSVLNAIRLMEYNAIQTAYSVEIARLEDPRLEPSLVYERKLRALYKQAQRSDHHNLVSNVLYCLFVYHTRHDFSLAKASDVVREMAKALRRYSSALTPYGSAVLANNIAQFALLYDVEESPEEFISIVELGLPPEWQNVGKIGICGYYLNTAQVTKARQLRSSIDMSNIAIEKELAAVAKLDLSFAWEDLKSGKCTARDFSTRLQAFYAMPGRRVYRELDFMARTQEILFLVHQGSYETALAKCEALRKFSERGAHKEFEFFRVIVQPYLTTVQALVQSKKPRVRQPRRHTVRWTRWAMQELERVIGSL